MGYRLWDCMYVKGCMYVCLELTLKWRFGCRLLVRECYSDQPEWKKMEVKLGKGRNLGVNQSQEGLSLQGAMGLGQPLEFSWTGGRGLDLYTLVSVHCWMRVASGRYDPGKDSFVSFFLLRQFQKEVWKLRAIFLKLKNQYFIPTGESEWCISITECMRI